MRIVKAADFFEAKSGEFRRVLLHDRVAAEYRALQAARDNRDRQRLRSLDRYFDRFCTMDPHLLQVEQFKPQGSFQSGQAKIQIWEFKAFAFRIYGATVLVLGKPSFVGVRVEPDKKQDKADPRTLQAAANDIAALEEFQANKR